MQGLHPVALVRGVRCTVLRRPRFADSATGIHPAVAWTKALTVSALTFARLAERM